MGDVGSLWALRSSLTLEASEGIHIQAIVIQSEGV